VRSRPQMQRTALTLWCGGVGVGWSGGVGVGCGVEWRGGCGVGVGVGGEWGGETYRIQV
jgi:hypothetical protein